ncbi:DMT family transporter [Pseudomonas sp. LRF_L74]|uniref:DMT family transporter n=1 Tax=Pseudomonas sp. LRF_L74 TaxID=3369422 RepID=UPI003F610CE8
MRQHALRADLLMLVTAMIWGGAFVAQRLGMDAIGPFLYTGLRFALASLALLPLIMLLGPRQARPISRGLVGSGVLMGVIITLGINLQQVGLLFTSVTNSGFITGLYVIVVPLLGLFLKQRTGAGTWLGAALAVVGMFLLSVGDGFHVAPGDWLQLAGAFVWGVHVLMVGAFANRYDALLLALLQFLTCTVISLLLAVALEPIDFGAIIQATPAILYGGLLGVAVGFTFQVIAQKHAIASHAAIILSLEAVFAAIAGALFLGESLSGRGYVGCLLMLAGMLVAQLWSRRETPAINREMA